MRGTRYHQKDFNDNVDPVAADHVKINQDTPITDHSLGPIGDYEHKLQPGTKDDGNIRAFSTGATRDTADGKLDPEGFTHPLVMKQFYKYMNMNRLQSDGKLRASDNWQKGIPMDAYMKSLKRHCDDLWIEHRGYGLNGGSSFSTGTIAALCGIIFNACGYLLEFLKLRNFKLQDFDGSEPTPEMKERIEGLKNARHSK